MEPEMDDKPKGSAGVTVSMGSGQEIGCRESRGAEGGGLGPHCKHSCLCPRGLGHESEGFKSSKPGQMVVNKKVYIIFAFILYMNEIFLNSKTVEMQRYLLF